MIEQLIWKWTEILIICEYFVQKTESFNRVVQMCRYGPFTRLECTDIAKQVLIRQQHKEYHSYSPYIYTMVIARFQSFWSNYFHCAAWIISQSLLLQSTRYSEVSYFHDKLSFRKITKNCKFPFLGQFVGDFRVLRFLKCRFQFWKVNHDVVNIEVFVNYVVFINHIQ